VTTHTTVLPKLNAQLVDKGAALPERVLQFGEGGFLRGFVDWMIDGMNKKGKFNGRVAVVQPISRGTIREVNQQNGLYTLLMRGVENGNVVERTEIVKSISRGIDPYVHFADFLAAAHNPDLRFVVSNTTEAGIVYRPEDKLADTPQASYPGKLTRFLFERYQTFQGNAAKGLILLPCELIDRNGDKLKKAVLQMAENWALAPEFTAWVKTACIFTNTLVDRIVTGYPKAEIGQLWEKAGYEDNLFDTSEVFHFWVIEGPQSIRQELPLEKCGFHVVFTDDMTPYRERKVRILNGSHTGMALGAYLAGKTFVGDCMKDPIIHGHINKMLNEEIIPMLTLPKAELEAFAAAVLERFANPFIQHELLSISLNSVSKYTARNLPILEQYVAKKGAVPTRLAFGISALIAFYRGTEIRNGALIGSRDGDEYPIKDNKEILEWFAAAWQKYDGTSAAATELVDGVLSQKTWWGKDLRTLPGLAAVVSAQLQSILTKGAAETFATL
jgi:tagaturonate reductase